MDTKTQFVTIYLINNVNTCLLYQKTDLIELIFNKVFTLFNQGGNYFEF